MNKRRNMLKRNSGFVVGCVLAAGVSFVTANLVMPEKILLKIEPKEGQEEEAERTLAPETEEDRIYETDPFTVNASGTVLKGVETEKLDKTDDEEESEIESGMSGQTRLEKQSEADPNGGSRKQSETNSHGSSEKQSEVNLDDDLKKQSEAESVTNSVRQTEENGGNETGNHVVSSGSNTSIGNTNGGSGGNSAGSESASGGSGGNSAGSGSTSGGGSGNSAGSGSTSGSGSGNSTGNSYTGPIIEILDPGNGDYYYTDDPYYGGSTSGGSTSGGSTSGGSTSGGSTSAGTEETPDDVILWGISSRYIDESELYDYDLDTLCLIRNEIFALHGRIFQTDYLREYFSSKSWYVPRYDGEAFDEHMFDYLNEYERANLQVILNYEEALMLAGY